jgi:hypothetical protein
MRLRVLAKAVEHVAAQAVSVNALSPGEPW